MRNETRLKLTLAFISLVFAAGPTVGDIGSCAQPAVDLDPAKFFLAKRHFDCEKCRECNFESQACADVCEQRPQDAFPEGCRPLVHDGEVCLDRLRAASCKDYEPWMRDHEPTAPSECQFCPSPMSDGQRGGR